MAFLLEAGKVFGKVLSILQLGPKIKSSLPYRKSILFFIFCTLDLWFCVIIKYYGRKWGCFQSICAPVFFNLWNVIRDWAVYTCPPWQLAIAAWPGCVKYLLSLLDPTWPLYKGQNNNWLTLRRLAYIDFYNCPNLITILWRDPQLNAETSL